MACYNKKEIAFRCQSLTIDKKIGGKAVNSNFLTEENTVF